MSNNLADWAQVAVGAISLWLGYKAIKSSNDTAAKLQHIEQQTTRAYVMPSGFPIANFPPQPRGPGLAGIIHQPPLDPNKPIEIKAKLKNKGTTPALNLRVTQHIQLISSDDNSAIHSMMPDASRGTIYLAVSEELEIGGGQKNAISLSKQDVLDIINDKKRLRFTVVATYEDVAGTEHTSSIVVYLNPKSLSQQAPPSITYERDGVRFT